MDNLFQIDTKGTSSLKLSNQAIESDDDEFDFDAMELDPTKVRIRLPAKKREKINKSKDIDLEEFDASMGWTNKKHKIPKGATKRAMSIPSTEQEVNSVDAVMAKSAIHSGFESLHRVPRYDVSRRQQIAKSKHERSKTKGKNWFNLPKTEMTPEIRHDLQVIQMRSVLDPKHFYKKNDIKALPKYFQIGKVMDSPIDFYNNRLTKKERKRTIVEELMADAEFSKFNKRKYKEIIDEKKKSHYKAQRRLNKLKKKQK